MKARWEFIGFTYEAPGKSGLREHCKWFTTGTSEN